MGKHVEYHPKAKTEIQESLNWYEGKVIGLGLEFLLEVKSAESQVVQNPKLYPIYEGETRRYLLKRFPYALVYLESADKITIVAVAHCMRKPGHWKNRLSKAA